jgi:hypothetical protein
MDANGAVDPSYQLIHPPFSNLTSGLMELMHPLSDGRLFVVSRRNRDRILQVRNPDGSPDTSFNAALTLLESTRQAGPGEVVRAVAEMEDGRLILAGNFDTYGEFPVIDHFRINADGSFDPSYESTGGFGLGDIISIVQRPGFLFFTSSAPARDNLNRLNSFQGNFDLGGGPVRVFNGGQESEPSLGD